MSASLELQLRRLILALLIFGLVALDGELVALGHYKDPWQWVPLALMTAALFAIGWHVFAGNAASLRAVQGAMILIFIAGATGVYLHYRGSVEFQHDVNPDLAGWALMAKVLRAKAPPALAPGALAQLGLLGLVYAFRHPALRGSARAG